MMSCTAKTMPRFGSTLPEHDFIRAEICGLAQFGAALGNGIDVTEEFR